MHLDDMDLPPVPRVPVTPRDRGQTQPVVAGVFAFGVIACAYAILDVLSALLVSLVTIAVICVVVARPLLGATGRSVLGLVYLVIGLLILLVT